MIPRAIPNQFVQSPNQFVQFFNQFVQFFNQLPDYPIIQLPDSPSPNPPLVLLLEDVRRVQIERRRGLRIGAAEFGVAAVADRQVLQPAVDDEIDQRGGGKNAVRDEIAAEPVEHPADQRADDHHGQPDLGIEILAAVKVGAVTHRTAIHGAIEPERLADLERDVAAAASARDRRRLFVAADRQARVARRTSGEDVQRERV